MTYATTSINPFYAARLRRSSPVRTPEPDSPIYARLPRAPITGSPVPHLTSLYHFHRAGEYGDRSYPGNCGGNLIKDLLQLLQARGHGSRPDDRQRHLPRRLRGTRHPLHVLGHPPGLRRLRPARISRSSGDVRFHLGTPALLAAEALCRRPARPVALPDARAFPAPIRPVHPQLCPRPQTRRQAGHPHGRLFATAMPDTSRWSSTPSGSPSRPG